MNQEENSEPGNNEIFVKPLSKIDSKEEKESNSSGRGS